MAEGPSNPGNYEPVEFRTSEDVEARELLDRLKDLLSKDKDRPLIISIPEREDPKQPGMYFFPLVEGEYELNFEEGEIMLTTSLKWAMKTGLKVQGKDFMRSLRIYTDKDVSITMQGISPTVIIGGQTIGFSDLKFTHLYINAYEDTNVRVMASTNPHLLDIDVFLPPALNNAVYDQDNGSKATAIQLDMGIFSRTVVEIGGKSNLPVPYTLEASLDGQHWFTIESFAAAINMHKGYSNAMRFVRVTPTVVALSRVDMYICATR